MNVFYHIYGMKILYVIGFICLFKCYCFSQDSITKTITQKGTASFYAQKFEGRKTSSGELFNHKKLTAAHKYLKFGTYVSVRNLKNDSVVIVKVNDRLPQTSKRTIDLTVRAAKQLNFIKSGLTKVEITVLDSLTH